MILFAASSVVRLFCASSSTSQVDRGTSAGHPARVPGVRRSATAALILLLLLAIASWLQPAANAQDAPAVQRGAVVTPEVHHDTSMPLRDMAPTAQASRQVVRPVRAIPRPQSAAGVPATDSALQSYMVQRSAPTQLLSFDGIGNGFTGPQGTFSVNVVPPDTNGAAGPNHYVQIVNDAFAVFNKSGTAIYGPININQLWSGFGGGCQTNNDGDPVVVYDVIADRFIISQFSVSTVPFLECVAVSQTGDPTGAYYRYSFSYGNSNFPDYPKMGVWPDAYYTTYNIFGNGGNTFSGAEACAFDRSQMLNGNAATQQCFTTSSLYGGILPANLDGRNLPPAGSPNYLVGLGANANQLAYWKFHVDWTTPANSTFTGPATLATNVFSEACNGGQCIPQTSTTVRLDSLADRVMYRLAYRNLGTHEALVVNHSVTAGSSVGVRWYELRPDASHNLSIFQQGTYAPDSNFRWMGSIAMDQSGNIGLGFSVSGTSMHPGIHYTGRLATDPAGLMTEGENSIFDGAGSQDNSGGGGGYRWGDYSAMSIDPSDDCTFWYTNEYIPSTGEFNWSTRVGSFKFPSCGPAQLVFTTPPPANLAVGAAPGTVKVSVEDSSGHVVTSSSATVTLRVTGPNSYSHTYTATASSGVATFSSLPGLSGGTYTYSATDTPDGLTRAVATEKVGASTLTSPTPGSVLSGPKVTFTWSAVTGATDYALWLGTAPGTYNLYASGSIAATSVTRTNLPTNGETIYARLTTIFGSTRVYNDYVYTAATQATLTAPTGSVLSGPNVTFSWSAGTGATGYIFWLGTTPGSYNLYGSGTTTATSVTRTNLPTNGETIYARLTTIFGSSRVYTDYVFTAATSAVLNTPPPGSTLSGAKVTFSWSAGTGSGYIFWLGTAPGTYNLYASGPITATSVTRNNLPTNGETIYARLTTIFGSSRVYTDYVYTAAP